MTGMGDIADRQLPVGNRQKMDLPPPIITGSKAVNFGHWSATCQLSIAGVPTCQEIAVQSFTDKIF